MDNYFSVLNAFIDKKDSYYSIHQIGKDAGCQEVGGNILSEFPVSKDHHFMFISVA